MALSDVTVTFNLTQLLGEAFDARRTRAYVKTNVANGTLMDTSTGEIRLGDQKVTVGDDGTGSFTTWAPGVDGNPTSWQTSLVVEYPRTGQRDRQVRTFGPYTITASADLADLEEEQAVPAEYLTQVTDELQTYSDAAEVSATSAAASATSAAASATTAVNAKNQASEIALGDADATLAAAIENPASDTYSALSASIVETGDLNYEQLATAAHRAAINADHAAAFARVQEKFTPALNGLYLARSGNDYTFLIGLGSGRFGAFLLPRQAQSLNSVTYTVNCLNGCAIQLAMLSQDDGTGTFAGSGSWTHQFQSDPTIGYLRKDIVVSSTSGSGSHTITTGTIGPEDSGKRVVITGAGASGGALTSTMTYVSPTSFTTGTAASTTGTGLAAVVHPSYRYNATAGATATWVSPANAVAVGARIGTGANNGLGKVTVTGAVAGAVAANCCPTAQQVVDSGRYPNTILVANGGTLDPTDRVIDFYSTVATYVPRAIAEGLAADTYTVVVTGTGYQATAGTAARITLDGWSYSLAATLPTTSGAAMFPALDLSPGFASAWEMAMECKPTSGSTWTFVGQTAHQLEDQQSLTIKINDAAATPADGTITACRSVELTRTTKLYHPETGAALASSPLGTATYVYRWDRNQLLLSVDIVFNVDTDVRTGYVMMPLVSRLGTPAKIDRAALEGCPDLLTMTGSGNRLGISRSAFGWAWDSTGKVGAGIYVPDHYGFTNGYASDVDGSQVEDRSGTPAATKFYMPWVGVNHTRTYEAGESESYTARYFVGHFADANATLAGI